MLSGTLALGALVPAVTVVGSLLSLQGADAGAATPVGVQAEAAGHAVNAYVRVPGRTVGSVTPQVNSNFAGYLTVQNPTSIQAVFHVPTLACPASGTYETSAGANVEGASDFENAFVYMFCINGSASYSGSFVYGPDGSPTVTSWRFTPRAGDKIKLKITTGATFTVTAKDVTMGRTSSVTGTCSGCNRTEANASMQIGPVPPFGTLDWTHVKVNGVALASSNPTLYQDVNGSDVLITTSAITGGTSFTNTFVASS